MESDPTSDLLKEFWKESNASVDQLMTVKRHDNKDPTRTKEHLGTWHNWT
jgi:hypothetical protein